MEINLFSVYTNGFGLGSLHFVIENIRFDAVVFFYGWNVYDTEWKEKNCGTNFDNLRTIQKFRAVLKHSKLP